MVDLNTLIPTGSGRTLTETVEINDRGEITVSGVLPSGDHHAILLIPCDEDHPSIEGCDYDLVDDTAAESKAEVLTQAPLIVASAPATPNGLKATMRERFARRYHVPVLGPKN